MIYFSAFFNIIQFNPWHYESFYHRIKNHDQSKDFWDLAIAIVSNTNSFEKSDVKYLESLAVEKALKTAAMTVLNRTVPARNNVHEFKVHTLEKILEDTAMIAESLGFSIFASKEDVNEDSVWYLSSKKKTAKAQFRGDKFIILAGSIIDKSFAPGWGKAYPKSLIEREDIFKSHGAEHGNSVEITSNLAMRNPNHAGGFVTGRNVNAWISWKNSEGKTMDEVMRREIV